MIYLQCINIHREKQTEKRDDKNDELLCVLTIDAI